MGALFLFSSFDLPSVFFWQDCSRVEQRESVGWEVFVSFFLSSFFLLSFVTPCFVCLDPFEREWEREHKGGKGRAVGKVFGERGRENRARKKWKETAALSRHFSLLSPHFLCLCLPPLFGDMQQRVVRASAWQCSAREGGGHGG